MATAQSPHRGVNRQCSPAPLESLLDRAQQALLAERFRQELDSSSLHRFHRHWHVAVASDEDYGHLRTFDRDHLLQIQPIQIRKIDVEDQAVWNGGSLT